MQRPVKHTRRGEGRVDRTALLRHDDCQEKGRINECHRAHHSCSQGVVLSAALPIAALAALALAAKLRRGSRSWSDVDDYGEPVDTRGSAARKPAPPKRHPLSDEERLDILGLAADEGMVSFSGGCGAVALAMREVLFDGQAEVVAAVNRHLWRQGRAVGHIGVRDLGGTVWDGEGTYEGNAVEEFMAWGMLDFSDPDHGLSSEEQAEEVLLLEGEEALAAAQQMPCPARAPDPGRVLRAARAAVEGRRRK